MILRGDFAAKAMQAYINAHITPYGHTRHRPKDQLASASEDEADVMFT